MAFRSLSLPVHPHTAGCTGELFCLLPTFFCLVMKRVFVDGPVFNLAMFITPDIDALVNYHVRRHIAVVAVSACIAPSVFPFGFRDATNIAPGYTHFRIPSYEMPTATVEMVFPAAKAGENSSYLVPSVLGEHCLKKRIFSLKL